LGVVLFEILTGQSPFPRASFAEHPSRVLPYATPDVRSLRPELDKRLVAVVESCLESERECRFSSVEELAGALSPFGSELSGTEEFSLSPFEVSTEEAAWLPPPWGVPQGHARRLSACS
jgi:serine/threonine protein kinase